MARIRTRGSGGISGSATKAAEFVRRLRLNVDRVDAGLVGEDEFHRVQRVIWDAVAAEGCEVELLVSEALRADLAVSR